MNIIEGVFFLLLFRKIWLEMKGILRAGRQYINSELAPLNLSAAESELLFLLLTGSDKLQQEQLAEQLDIGKAAVSRALSSLEEKGYVVRKRQPEDRRAYSVTLTEKAVKAGSEIKRAYQQLHQRVKAGIPEEEFIRAEKLLTRISENLQAKEEENDP